MLMYIQAIYRAHGSNASAEWLAMISPCINILRQLAREVHNELGSRQGVKHTSPDLQRDIARLMQSLSDHEVYEIKEGRTIDDDSENAEETASISASGTGVVPNCVSEGYAQLAAPLQEYNAAFRRLQAHVRARPLVGEPYISDNNAPPLDEEAAVPAQAARPVVDTQPLSASSADARATSSSQNAPVHPEDEESDHSDAESEDEDAPELLDRYFSLENAGDVALDMDVVEDIWDSTEN